MDSNKPPKVSVIIPSYNHALYINECIDSVLNQTYQNFEIVITDDGSEDNTQEIIQSYDDPRIHFYKHSHNKGACIAANNCLEKARGKYIAMLSSDDAWYPEKLEIQVKYLENNPNVGAVFGKAEWVGESGDLILDTANRFRGVFDVKNSSRFEWLNYFFYRGNCLCHPCSLIRKECYDTIGNFNPRLANLPDFDLWVRLLFHFNIHVMDKKLVRFRWLRDGQNASGDNLTTHVRAAFEFKQIINHYLEIKHTALFEKIFPEAQEKFRFLHSDLIPYYLSMMAIESNREFKVLWGLETLYRLLEDEVIAAKLEREHGFSFNDYLALTGRLDVFNISRHFPAANLDELSIGAIPITKRFIKDIYSVIRLRYLKK